MVSPNNTSNNVNNNARGIQVDAYEVEYFTSLRNSVMYMFEKFVDMYNQGKLFNNTKNTEVKEIIGDGKENIFFESFNVYVKPSSINVLTSSRFVSGTKPINTPNTSHKCFNTSADIIQQIILAEKDIREEFSMMANLMRQVCKYASYVIKNEVDVDTGRSYRDIYTGLVIQNLYKGICDTDNNIKDNIDCENIKHENIKNIKYEGTRKFFFNAYNRRFEIDCNSCGDVICQFGFKGYCPIEDYYEDYMNLERFRYEMEYIARNLWVEVMEFDTVNCIAKIGIGVRREEICE